MKVAKLVTVTLRTRVIVDENATEEEISKAAEAGILHRIHNGEMYENSDIEDDTECPVTQSELYYQPSFLGDTLPGDLYDHEVFASKEKAARCFPGFEILEFSGDDIEGKVFVDDDFEDEQA